MKTTVNLLIILFFICGCSSKTIKQGSSVTTGSEKIISLDVNKDGKVDSLFAQKVLDQNSSSTLWRKDDLNFDGKFDIEQDFDNDRIKTERIDLDFDGKFDAFNYYDEGVISKSEYSLSPSGKIEMWVYYKDGKPLKKEVDTKHAGKPDYFEFYKDSKIDRIGKDIDGDGIVDIWE
jgi:antitoxin component YwqK of YwqJK toxin-antitoxin module